MAIKKFEESFHVNVVGELSGESYMGKFTVRTRMSFKDALTRDSVRRNLLGASPETASVRANSVADVFSELAVRVVEAPSWWTNSDNGIELVDDNVVAEIYKAAMDAGKAANKETVDQATAQKKDLEKE